MKQADGRSSNPVQVFEVTMDNPEDQDELNRRLRKPGEPTPSSTGTPRPDLVPGAGRKKGKKGPA